MKTTLLLTVAATCVTWAAGVRIEGKPRANIRGSTFSSAGLFSGNTVRGSNFHKGIFGGVLDGNTHCMDDYDGIVARLGVPSCGLFVDLVAQGLGLPDTVPEQVRRGAACSVNISDIPPSNFPNQSAVTPPPGVTIGDECPLTCGECTQAPTTEFEGDNTLLTEKTLLMTHDSGTGYFRPVRGALVKTQNVGIAGQLACGARAFDVRMVEKHGKMHYQHMPSEKGVLLPGVVTEEDLESDMKHFVEFANANDDLLVLIVTHCSRFVDKTCEFKLWGVTVPSFATSILTRVAKFFGKNHGVGCLEKVACADPTYGLADIFQEHKLLVLNEHCKHKPDCLKTLTVQQIKDAAQQMGQENILVVLDNKFHNDNWPEEVKAGEYGKFKQEVADFFNRTGRYEDIPDPPRPKLEVLQAHWQGVGAMVGESTGESDGPFGQDGVGERAGTDDDSTKTLKGRILNPILPIMQNVKAKTKKLNLLQINWICNRGAEIAEALGTTVNKDQCQKACARSHNVLDWSGYAGGWVVPGLKN